jgi:phenylacetate-CoA ligase
MDIRPGDVVLPIAGFGPHVFVWGAVVAMNLMNVAVIPGGGMDGKARANVIDRFKPTVLVSTPSYALYLGRTMQDLGMDPATSSIRTVFVGGEAAMGIDRTRERIEDLWGARLAEFYGCTEVSPHAGGFTCPHAVAPGRPPATHLSEDIQIWELIDPDSQKRVPEGERGVTVCTSLNSESSPQLRFLVGDYSTFDTATCGCGRNHVRAVGSFTGRADDLINLRGVKMFPSQIEQAVRSVDGVGDEYEVVLSTQDDGLDVMHLRVEHPDPTVAGLVADEVRSRCEIRATVEVLAPDTLPKTEFKARRVKDQRGK